MGGGGIPSGVNGADAAVEESNDAGGRAGCFSLLLNTFFLLDLHPMMPSWSQVSVSIFLSGEDSPLLSSLILNHMIFGI